MQEGGLEVVLECMIRRDRTGLVLQAYREASDEGDRNGSQDGEGKKRGVRVAEKESFDAKILSMTILTNCAEKFEPVRDRLGGARVKWSTLQPTDGPLTSSTAIACELAVIPPLLTPGFTPGSIMSVPALLSKYLKVLIGPFMDQFNRVRKDA